jgi:UDP-2,3-diacylglucosamine hydrolase
MTTLFISDIHISDDYPEINKHFFDFIKKINTNVNALYILGDLFEYWLGDDDPNPIFKKTQNALKNLSKNNVSVFFLHGNRDFLVGDEFANKSHIKILSDPSVIELYGERILISHGDIFCTDDKEYQLFRKQTRDPRWQKMILKKPLGYRRDFAQMARMRSIEHTQLDNENIMDVNENEIKKTFEHFNLSTIIHGHTHRPFIHNTVSNKINYRRIVLGDWYEQGSILEWSESGPKLIKLNRNL